MTFSALISPKTIAVVGASRDPQKVGHHIFRNALATQTIEVFPVNPNANEILGVRCFPTLAAIQKPLDVVIVATPVSAVEEVVDACIALHVQGVVILSAGFAETGEEGKRLQERIAQKLSVAGIALIGPNTMGYMYLPNNLNLTFGPREVERGNIAVMSQSGALLSAMFQEFSSLHTGISFAISLGNRAGVTECDALEFAWHDPATKVIALYIESFASLPKFFALAERVSRDKPVFVLKGGSTERGVHAAVSHTAALATPQVLLEDASHQYGFVLVNSMRQLIHTTSVASHTTFLPENIAVVTNAGGPSVILLDESSKNNVPLAEFSSYTHQALHDALPQINIANPLDLLGDATAKTVESALDILSRDLQIDSIVCLLTQQSVTDMQMMTDVLIKPRGKKPLFCCLVGGDQLQEYRMQLRKSGVMTVEDPTEVVELFVALRMARKAQKHQETLQFFGAPAHRQYPETYHALTELLSSYGFQFPRFVLCKTGDDLSSVSHLQFPLVAKTTDLELKHKANVGAIVKNITTMDQAKTAYEKLCIWNDEVVFQETVLDGIEILLGAKKDEQFGWYIAVGLGGSFTNVISDRSHCFLPATRMMFQEVLSRTKLGAVVTPTQMTTILDLMESMQRVVLETSNLQELEFNPIFITQTGYVVADMKRI